jgi:hypothetical protein
MATMSGRIPFIRALRFVGLAIGFGLALTLPSAPFADYFTGRFGVQLAAQQLPAEPVPIQRIVLPPERLEAEMQRVRQNVLTRMPRENFEKLLREAARAHDAARMPPRLVEARYRAKLSGEALLGTADWRVLHTARGPGRIPLNSVQIALRDVRWSDDRPALLGFLDDRSNAPLELLVDRSGEQTLRLEWSARGVPEPDGLRFDLRLPPCPIATLELELPSDQTPLADRDTCLVSGPWPGAKAGQQRWQVTTIGTADLIQLTLQRPRQSDQPGPLLRPLLQTKQRLSPGQVECEFDVDLLVQNGNVRELLFDCDPGLRPYQVIVSGEEGWETADGPSGATRLAVRLREPFAGGRVLIRALAPLGGGDATWRSPGLSVAGGISRGETLTLRVHPDLQLDAWAPGGFRLVDSLTAADRTQVLTMRSVLGITARPEVRIRPAGTVLDVKENIDWSVDAGGGLLTAQLEYDVVRGSTAGLNFSVPPGWDVDTVESSPADPSLSWRVLQGRRLAVELGRPWTPLAGVKEEDRWHYRLAVRLRSPAPPWATDTEGLFSAIPFPDLRTLGVRQREGSIALHTDPALSASVNTELPQIRADVFGIRNPSAEGTLIVRPKATRLQAKCLSETRVLGGRMRSTFRLQLRPTGRAGRDLLLFTSTPVAGAWEYHTLHGPVEIQGMAPTAELGVPALLGQIGIEGPLSSATGLAWRRALHGRCWRLTLDRPLREPVEFELSCEGPGGASRLEIPLLMVPGTEAMTGSIVLTYPAGADWVVESNGLTPTLPQQPGAKPSPALTQRFWRCERPPSSLRLVKSSDTTFDPAPVGAGELTTMVRDGRIRIRFRFAVCGWQQRLLPVRAPNGSRLLSAQVNGQTVSGPANGGAVINLPWPAGQNCAEAELIFELPAGRVLTPARLQTSEPELPFALAVRRIWRLPDDLAPIVSSDWKRLPGGSDSGAWSRLVAGLRPDSRSDLSRRQLTEAARSLPAPATLGEGLARLVFETNPDNPVLVVDAASLWEEGITRETSLTAVPQGAPFWDAASLTLLPGSSALLLTTRGRALAWKGAVPADADDAVTEAVASGRDRSGRFQLAVDWLGRGGDNRTEAATFSDPAEPWSDWAAPPASGTDVLVVPARVVTASGLLATVLISAVVALAWLRRWRARGPFLVAWPIVAALTWLWLPAGLAELAVWQLAAGLVALAVVLIRAIFNRRRSGDRAASSAKIAKPTPAVITAALVLALAFVWTGKAAGPDPVPVYLVPGPPDDPEPTTVLVPPTLIEQLQAMIHRGAPAAPALILSARYDGRIEAAVARFEADFLVYSCRDEAVSLPIPVRGVLLRGARVDEAPAYPSPDLGAEQFSFELAKPGLHSLKLVFDVPITGTLTREVRFGIPELATSRLTVHAPADAARIQALSWRGAQNLIVDQAGSRLEADLGRVGIAHLRWRDPGSEPAAKSQVRELSLWDIGESAARLRHTLRFQLGSNRISSAEFDIPPELEVASGSAWELDERGLASNIVGLRDLRRPAASRVRLEFQTSLTGQALVMLELIPKQPLDRRPHLPVPSVVGDYARDRFVAVRSQGWEVAVPEATGLAPMAREAFHELWRPVRGFESNPRLPDLVFHCLPGQDPGLKLTLTPPKGSARGRQHITWLLGPARADVQANVTLAGRAPAGLLEWNIPADVHVTELLGRDVRSWSRSEAGVQIWLDRNVDTPADREVSVEMNGWLARPASADRQDSTTFALPPLSFSGVEIQTTDMEVKPRAGWRVSAVDAGKFRALPDTDLPGFRWAGIASEPPGQTVFLAVLARGQADLSLLTVADVHAGQFHFTTTIDVSPPVGRKPFLPNSIQVDARHFPGNDVKWEIPPEAQIRQTRTRADGGSWVIDLAPGSHRLALSGSRRLPAAASDFLCPEITGHALGPDSGRTVRRLAIRGDELRPGEPTGWRAISPTGPGTDAVQTVAPGNAVSLFVAERDTTQLRLFPTGIAAARTMAVSVPVELSCSRANDGSWWMNARCWITSGGAEWSVRIPEPGGLRALSVDGYPLSPNSDATGRVLLPLPREAPQVHQVRLRWQTPRGARDDPKFSVPALEAGGIEVKLGPVFWTLEVPPGMRLRPKSGAPLAGAAAFDLARAAALSELLHRPGTIEANALLHARIEMFLARAEYRLNAQIGLNAGETGPDGQPLAEWLAALRQTNLPPKRAARDDESEPLFSSASLRARGRPYHWRSADLTPPIFELEPDPDSNDRLAVSGILAILLAFGTVWAYRRSQP